MDDWEKRLNRAGCRITAPRRAIMQILQDSQEPLSPQGILEQANGQEQHLGLVTVYRNLSLLEELELVRRVHRLDGCHGYVLASPGHNHAIICQRCGDVVEFPGGDDLHALVERVESNTGYAVCDHLLQLFGVCPHCQHVANAGPSTPSPHGGS